MQQNEIKTELYNLIEDLENNTDKKIIKQKLEEINSVINTGLKGVIEDAIYNAEKGRQERTIECVYDAITVIERCER